jgi:hypothetical protein
VVALAVVLPVDDVEDVPDVAAVDPDAVELDAAVPCAWAWTSMA